mgnify:CR=1 FL=1
MRANTTLLALPPSHKILATSPSYGLLAPSVTSFLCVYSLVLHSVSSEAALLKLGSTGIDAYSLTEEEAAALQRVFTVDQSLSWITEGAAGAVASY